MTDRRLLKYNGRIAHISLRNKVEASVYTQGESHQVVSVVADLCAAPDGRRDRQLLRGENFVVLDAAEGWVFGYATKDDYVGWVEACNLVAGLNPQPTHRIDVQLSYAKSTPGLKKMGMVTALPFGALVTVLEDDGDWSRIAWERLLGSLDLYVPSRHLAPIETTGNDPVSSAKKLLGTPYLWGGNSAFGIDCSGLVQTALLSCGISCPGDSDLQEAAFPKADSPFQPGDLLFWKGHVAMMADATTLIHANAHHMSVTLENTEAAIARIDRQGDGPVTSHKRPKARETT